MIPNEAENMIEQLITIDEGGYRFDKQLDNDGGWTYAGVTALTWADYFPDDLKTSEQMAEYIADNSTDAASKVHEIYYRRFYIPTSKALELYSVPMHRMFLSCGVNCGMGTLRSLVMKAFQDGKPEDESVKNFLHRWRQYYCNLVQAKPKQFVPSIEGWINRVDRYA